MVRSLGWGCRLCFFIILCCGLRPALARDLPDFTALVAAQGSAVVNIAIVSDAATPLAAGPGLGRGPLSDFFRRFVPDHPPVPQREPEPDGAEALGSGFIISADGYILTNAHVVARAGEVVVRLADRRELPAQVVGTDARSDVALLKVAATGLPVVRLGDPAALLPGEWVVAIGSPFGFDHSVTAGIVSALGRSLPDENFVPFIQTDVAINPGNSGGPLFNLRGEVIGMNSQIYSETGGFMGLSFAIPIDVVMDVQTQLREHGHVSRGRIGVAIQEVSRELADSFALADAHGALVNHVEPGGPAARAGVRPGDVITVFDGREVRGSAELPRIVAAARPGERVRLWIVREGVGQALEVELGAWQDEPAPLRVRVTAPHAATGDAYGLRLVSPTPAQRRERALQQGLLVEQARGAAARAGIRAGDVVLATVSGGRQHALRQPDDYRRALAALAAGEPLTLLVLRGEMPSYLSLRPAQ